MYVHTDYIMYAQLCWTYAIQVAIVGLQLFKAFNGGISRQSINNLFISDWKKAQNNNFVVLCLF